MLLVKLNVCVDCLSPDIVDPNCVCTYDRNYKTVELEFEKCSCCGHLNSRYVDTEFNSKQLETLQND